MKKIAIITDSNSGITQSQAQELGIYVLPMPFMINNKTYFEDIDLSQEEFYSRLEDGNDISTSQPSPDSVMNLWDKLLNEYDEIVHIPMSSGLSGSCSTALALANDYNGRIQVVNNQRISVTQRQSVLDALQLAESGRSALEIREFLEQIKLDSSIYVMVDTLKYLKKGGRITPAAAALGTLLKIKPVLQIQGEKLDAFAKARTIKQAKTIMLDAIKNDMAVRFNDDGTQNKVWLQIAHSNNEEAAAKFKEELQAIYPNYSIHMDPLSLSISCHVGPGTLAVACSKKITL
ncbi:DegV family protein [Anaerosacchariphilus polymeriproducens]|uniref:DegV family protein n=1 Tax=Anaerosacchariphilus polymeriproducens TaxID=1812858 RepID=A0A371AWL0_9FIRM|nr:DegV family protein [Anaerosacchariphilus polymeriproducens]RDU23958.1 DegV family protein [Anaerosacchariphilus polymeriproducens]